MNFTNLQQVIFTGCGRNQAFGINTLDTITTFLSNIEEISINKMILKKLPFGLSHIRKFQFRI